MKFSFAPLATLAVAASSLFLSAYAYVDYDELDARSIVDSYGYDSLSARSDSIEVPFQHSLRSFLEEAVVAHRRALDDEDQLEARANVNVNFRLDPPGEIRHLSLATTTPIGHAIFQWANRYHAGTGAFVITELQVFIGERLIHVDWEGANDPTLAQLGVQDGTTIRLVITVNMRTGTGSKGADKKPPAKKAPAKKAPGKAPPAAKPAAPAKRR
ncbi:hypothetical protein DFP72DRAFT_915510 [Ephemerocybe angulata]|uniref:Uncharacterized protein n=1 Tax=Ephemerocybe angulata TaxID=980116 RepID=A0A8H6M0I2_9AGAR|nr:hypothetical protein DFP72DRAFT_915510 [Tulosesus angulatus]